MQAMASVLDRGKRVIVLVPEISLTPQTVSRFVGRFGARVAVLHSNLSDGERYDQWQQIKGGAADIVVGPRSAIFAPFPNLGLIVIDEEHETSYKQDAAQPFYHARDVAVKRSRVGRLSVDSRECDTVVGEFLSCTAGRSIPSCGFLPAYRISRCRPSRLWICVRS